MNLFFINEIDDVGDRGTIFSPWRAFSYCLTPAYHRHHPDDMVAVNAVKWLNEAGLPYIVHATQMSTHWRGEDSSLIACWTVFIDVPADADAAMFRLHFPDLAMAKYDEIAWDGIG